ncbi:MAG TPA: nucleotidyltransferase domain-containing protein [Thermomicrobiales bacterium]|nr:nucleotidyltransferase domain-containing protein [Thermomicrobiales bacterium]
MKRVALLQTTGNERIDAILRGLIEVVEAAFPDRVRGYYLKGSYAGGGAVATSDIDLTVVFKGGALSDQEEERIQRVGEARSQGSSARIDLDAVGERCLRQGVASSGDSPRGGYLAYEAIRLKTASLLLYGEDIRDDLSLPMPEAYIHLVTHAPCDCSGRVLRGATMLVFPLTYPDPTGEFYGYDVFRLGNVYSPTGRGTKDLVASAGWIATALIALKAGRYVGSKSDSLRLYRECINDEWMTFLADLYEYCRSRWAYLVPEDEVERQRLRALCRRMLAFENHYLAVYEDYLLAELRSANVAAQLAAIRRLGQVIYRDGEVAAELRALAGSGDEPLREAASAVMRQI